MSLNFLNVFMAVSDKRLKSKIEKKNTLKLISITIRNIF